MKTENLTADDLTRMTIELALEEQKLCVARQRFELYSNMVNAFDSAALPVIVPLFDRAILQEMILGKKLEKIFDK
jgi:hypothetical protein